GKSTTWKRLALGASGPELIAIVTAAQQDIPRIVEFIRRYAAKSVDVVVAELASLLLHLHLLMRT
ncbi:MAG: hypothetical protein ACKPKO_59185, partial [Candidatus Fonsibacter sp.]